MNPIYEAMKHVANAFSDLLKTIHGELRCKSQCCNGVCSCLYQLTH